MTLESTLSKKNYKGNGLARQFPIPFFVAEATHIFLIIKDENGSRPITNNFSVNLDSKIVEYPLVGEALSSSQEITIYRKVPLNQIVDLENAGAFHPKVLEKDGFDRIVMQIQQLAEESSRSIKLNIDDKQTPSGLLEAIFDAKDTSIEKAQDASESAHDASVSAEKALVSEVAAKESENSAMLYADIAENWAIADIAENEHGSAKYWALQASELVPDAMEDVKGKACLATDEEVIDGIVANKIVTPKGFHAGISTHNADANAHGNLRTDINVLESFVYGEIGQVRSGHTMNDAHYIPADGRIVDLANYPELLEKIQSGKIHHRESYLEEYQGIWSLHEGTQYRAPDMQGHFVRFSTETVGLKEGDAIRDITGYFSIFHNYFASASGALSVHAGGNTFNPGYMHQWGYGRVSLNISRAVPTASENRPKNIYQYPVIYLGRVASEMPANEVRESELPINEILANEIRASGIPTSMQQSLNRQESEVI